MLCYHHTMTQVQLEQLRSLVSQRGINAIAAESGMHRMTLLRLLSSDVVAVHAGSKALALAYLAKVGA
jgi:hypothetical protein